METCVGWLLDVYIEDDKVILWIKTQDGKVIKLVDDYHPSFYILPKNEHDRKELLHIFSQQVDIVQELCCEEKPTSLFDSNGSVMNLIFVGIGSIRAYKHILKKLENDPRVQQLFNTDLLDVQQYLFNKLKIVPASKVGVKYDGFKLNGISKIDDYTELAPPPFSLIWVEIEAVVYSHEDRRFRSLYVVPDNNPILAIRVRDENNNDIYFQATNEEFLIRNFADYIMGKNPDIIVCAECTPIQHLFGRIKKLGLEGIQLGRDDICCVNDDELFTSIKNPEDWWIRGRICISNKQGYELISLLEMSHFSFLPLAYASKCGISHLIDSRMCYELIQSDFVIPSKGNAVNHEQIRTFEDIVKNDKGGMIISPRIGLHENVIVLDYENEYANLIVNYNLSYETVSSSSVRETRIVYHQERKALLPRVVEQVLKR